jgi:TolB-like protein
VVEPAADATVSVAVDDHASPAPTVAATDPEPPGPVEDSPIPPDSEDPEEDLPDGAIADSASLAVVRFVKRSTRGIESPVLAIIPCRSPDGSKSMEGQLIAEQVMTELSLLKGIRVVERQRLEDALAEQKLSAEGFVSPETAVRAGKLTGANTILTGSITDLGDVVEMHVRIVSVESGEVVSARKIRARRTIKTFISPLWDDMDRIKTSGKEFKAKLWLNKDRLRIGDTAVIGFSADKDCYVTIFDFSTDGSIAVLFPNRYQRNNRVVAGREYRVPSPDAGYSIQVRGPAGIERLKLFATDKDIELYAKDYSQSPFSVVDPEDDGFVRGLQTVVDGMATSEWGECSCEFVIENVVR